MGLANMGAVRHDAIIVPLQPRDQTIFFPPETTARVTSLCGPVFLPM